MDTSALQLTVIYISCSLFLTVPYGSRNSENAAVTSSPVTCYGNYAFARVIGKHANGAQLFQNQNTLVKCKTFCSQRSSCDSFDYNYGSSQCWVHDRYVENALRDSGGIDHFERITCPTTEAPPTSTAPTTPSATTPGVTGGAVPDCINNYSYDDFEDVYVIGGKEHSHNTLLSCLQACSNSPLTGTNGCTAVDYTSDNKCWFHHLASGTLARKTGTAGSVTHYVRESCASPTPTTIITTVGPTVPSPNAVVTFSVMFTNDYDATVRNVDSFINTFRTEFCDDTGIRCERLLKPLLPADVVKVTVKENPGPAIGSIIVMGMLAPADASETDTETVMTEFNDDYYENFRHRLAPANDNIRLKPDTSEDYDGFTWARVPTTDAPPGKEDEDEGPLGLKAEYWILIGLAFLALIVTIVAIVVICCLRQSNSKSSDNAQKNQTKEDKKIEQERKKNEKVEKKKEKEEKKKAEQEKKDREKEEKEQKKKEKKDKDVEKGESEENTYTEPDVVPTKVDDAPSGLSDDDKAY